jgi:lysophospholipase L1-like esterase
MIHLTCTCPVRASNLAAGRATRAALLILLALWIPAALDGAEVIAARADDFLSSIGVCSAVSRRGESLAKTAETARYLGLRWIRAGYESGIPVADLIELHKQTGVRFSYGLMSGGTDLTKLLDWARQLARAGALVALEGNNEPNNWGVTYEGQRGGGTNSWLAVARLQRDLYRLVKSDPVLKNYPVWSPSEIGAESDNVGLQFLTIPDGATALMPDKTQFADYANCHNYMTHPAWAGLHDNQTWIAADPTAACRVDGLYGNHGRTWRRHFVGYPESALAALPKVTTETGITIEGPITEQVQALLYLSAYLDQYKRGWAHTAIYLLRDRSDEAGNQTFGFYKPDYTPRLAANYLHNLTTILTDTASGAAPGKLSYTIQGQSPTVHDLLLQKSDGRFELVVWCERFTGGSEDFEVQLSQRAPSLKVFDPTIGSSPVKTVADAASVSLTLSNHPVIIEIPGSTSRASAPDPKRFDRDIREFLAADGTNPPPQKAILFIGSSIFRQWSSLLSQMAPLPVFNRAFGGSITTDLLHYMNEIVLPYAPRVIVYYCGSNDINAGRTAPEIFDGFRQFVERVHARLPQARILYVSVNRAPQKKDKWDVVDAVNRLTQDYCATNHLLDFIDVNPSLFDAAGEPRLDLYQTDQLHFKEPAYEGFAKIIKPVVDKAWAEATDTSR